LEGVESSDGHTPLLEGMEHSHGDEPGDVGHHTHRPNDGVQSFHHVDDGFVPNGDEDQIGFWERLVPDKIRPVLLTSGAG
jgi:hypothetical protein